MIRRPQGEKCRSNHEGTRRCLREWEQARLSIWTVSWDMAAINKAMGFDLSKKVVDSIQTIPLWEKANLTLEEAAAYYGVGINKLRFLTNTGP